LSIFQGESSKTMGSESKGNFEPMEKNLENKDFDNKSKWSAANYSDSKNQDSSFYNLFSEEVKSYSEDHDTNKNEKKSIIKVFISVLHFSASLQTIFHQIHTAEMKLIFH
jgi:hypothetical protein